MESTGGGYTLPGGHLMSSVGEREVNSSGELVFGVKNGIDSHQDRV